MYNLCLHDKTNLSAYLIVLDLLQAEKIQHGVVLPLTLAIDGEKERERQRQPINNPQILIQRCATGISMPSKKMPVWKVLSLRFFGCMKKRK